MLGKKIKDLRKNQGLKQSELAAAVGVTRSQIATYETNKGKPSYDVLIKIADFFKMPLDYFHDNNTEKLFLQSLDLSDEDFKKRIELYYAGEKLSDEDIKRILHYVRFLKSNNDNK